MNPGLCLSLIGLLQGSRQCCLLVESAPEILVKESRQTKPSTAKEIRRERGRGEGEGGGGGGGGGGGHNSPARSLPGTRAQDKETNGVLI